jgi:hypothetical protein
MSATRLVTFYLLVDRLNAGCGEHKLADCSGNMDWPRRVSIPSRYSARLESGMDADTDR